ncbi:His-Xaa-Ser system protein HxsD [Nannocystis bainbridge]|uniref:His-Xaa-Ser system protein HxsD n=1 Tax=Nannocystis bainbridge TaxID=2995303 RepID=A0ABT5E6L9_9BACT|nr:His-Xaa-Ser system protein HxsD [Nannocystis bainbridge]MDC0721507.1 His-Xaa-Ser system protein HxsD [Nannocystis bainbridge]
MTADDRFDTRIDVQTYRPAAIKKAAYRVAERCTVRLEPSDSDEPILRFTFPPRTSDTAAAEAVRVFYQELLDEELRAQLHEETDALRSLILAHAFSRTDLLQR